MTLIYLFMSIVLAILATDVGIRYFLWWPKSRGLVFSTLVLGIAIAQTGLAIATALRSYDLLHGVTTTSVVFTGATGVLFLIGLLLLFIGTAMHLIPVLQLNYLMSRKRSLIALAWRLTFAIGCAIWLVLAIKQ